MGPSGRSRVVNERSTSLVVVGGSTGGLRGTLFHRGSFYFILFYFFLSFFLSFFFLFHPREGHPADTVECHGAKRDPNCARLVKDQLPSGRTFKKRLRSYSKLAQG